MIERLSFIQGVWKGKGIANFPTIETTEYLEELKFIFTGDDDTMIFEQKTWCIENGQKGKPLHWESGFIAVYPDGSLKLFNAQNSKRVEVLKCHSAEYKENKMLLTFESEYFGNDERMVRTVREYHVNDDRLKFKMKMATKTTPEFQTHLKSELYKVTDSN